MERSAVYDSIDSERTYQTQKWGTIREHPHEVGGWLTLMQVKLNLAVLAWANNRCDHSALCELRKALAIGVACAQQHGLPQRIV